MICICLLYSRPDDRFDLLNRPDSGCVGSYKWTEGGPFPQVIEARLETFVLQAKRLHIIMAAEPAPFVIPNLAKAAMY